MRDEVFYCSNIEQLKIELMTNNMIDNNGNYTHGNTITPIIYNGVKSLSLVRDNKLDLTKFPSLTNLGTYAELFANPVSEMLYKSVYPYDVPITFIDELGITHTIERSKYIGVFA
jgi:hypothetical protein